MPGRKDTWKSDLHRNKNNKKKNTWDSFVNFTYLIKCYLTDAYPNIANQAQALF